MSSVRAYAAKITREVEEEVEGAVRLGRKLRAALKSTQGMQKEVDSVKCVIDKLIEYAASQRMSIEFKKCNAVASTEDDEEEEDGREEEHYYEVQVEMKRIDERSNDGRLVRATDLAEACAKEIRSGLKHLRGAVTLDEVRASYSAQNEAYVLCVFVMPPPTPRQSAVAVSSEEGSKKKRKERETEEHVQLPSADECVAFYTKRPRTWKLFGYNVAKKKSAQQ